MAKMVRNWISRVCGFSRKKFNIGWWDKENYFTYYLGPKNKLNKVGCRRNLF